MQHESSVQLFRNFQPLRNKKNPYYQRLHGNCLIFLTFPSSSRSSRRRSRNCLDPMACRSNWSNCPHASLLWMDFQFLSKPENFFFFLSFNRFSYDEEYLLQKLIRCFSKINFKKKIIQIFVLLDIRNYLIIFNI